MSKKYSYCTMPNYRKKNCLKLVEIAHVKKFH